MSQRHTRRLLVLATLAVTALLASALPGSLRGLGMLPTLVLVALDIPLIRATGGLAFSPVHRLDERQAARRNRAFRRGFRLLGLAVVLLMLIASVGTGIAQTSGGQGMSQVDHGISGRVIVALLELVVMMPTLVLAWTEPDGGDEPQPRGRRRWVPWLVLPAIASGWLLAVAVAPPQAAAASTNWSISGPSLAGASCRHIATGRVVGAGFGGIVGMRAEVCWNGHRAFLFGDPASPPPPGVIPAELAGMPPIPDLTACGADNEDDFAAVSGTRCTATTDPDATLHYTVRARVEPLPFGIAARDVALSLVVTRDGRVLEAP